MVALRQAWLRLHPVHHGWMLPESCSQPWLSAAVLLPLPVGGPWSVTFLSGHEVLGFVFAVVQAAGQDEVVVVSLGRHRQAGLRNRQASRLHCKMLQLPLQNC